MNPGQNHRLTLALAKLDAGTREDFDERAGIMEHDGGFARVDAERYAWLIVVQGKPYVGPSE